MRAIFVLMAVGVALGGCSAVQTQTPKTLGSACATAGAALHAIAVAAPIHVQEKALKIAGVLTPACSAATPASAESTAVAQALAELTKLAAPYETTGATKS